MSFGWRWALLLQEVESPKVLPLVHIVWGFLSALNKDLSLFLIHVLASFIIKNLLDLL